MKAPTQPGPFLILMSQDKYIIQGGAEGKKRLDRLGSILNDGTLALLRRLQPGPIDHLLDLGCGGGSVALLLARSGVAAQVTGMDFDERVLDLARRDAEAAGLANVQFEAGDAAALAAGQRFDITYARFLLSHLTDPLLVLRKMRQATRAGGLILVEDIDFSGHYCYPPNDAFARYLHYFVAAAQHNGQDPHIGLRLFRLFHEAGISEVGFQVVQPAFHTGSGKWMAYDTLEKIGGTVLRQGLATESQLQAALNELQAFTADDSSLISLPRIFQVWGRRH